MQSRILTPPYSSSSEIIPFNPVSNSSIIHGIFESSFHTMTLKCHHIHAISKIHNFHSLNFNLANGIWHVLKDLSRSIHKATDPTLNLFEALVSQLNSTVFAKLKCYPCIFCRFRTSLRICYFVLQPVRKYTDFSPWQTIGMETLEWIAEAKK